MPDFKRCSLWNGSLCITANSEVTLGNRMWDFSLQNLHNWKHLNSSKVLCPCPRDTPKCPLWHISYFRVHSYPRGSTGGPVGCLRRGYKTVLEIRGMSCNRMAENLGRMLVPCCVRSPCPWPFTINNKYYTLGVITQIFISILLDRGC